MLPISDVEKSRRFPIVNLLFIGLNILAFILQITTADPEGFIMQYALVPANINFSDWTTLFPFLTSMFLHGGLLHIGSNMLFLWVFGDNVEGEIGPIPYAILYLGSGIVGALAQYFLSPNSTIPMLGASGAVAGALGAYFLFFPNHRIRTLITLPFLITFTEVSAKIMLGYWIFLQILSGFFSIGALTGTEGGVAYWAHIGGFVAGYLLAKYFPTRDPQLQRIA
jgi:membrane associated rhomboid family serine protease